ncbi:MAG TPA: PKD domain-containing protein [Candidatus Thermoplasmatota archaeon]|nr:PKD domain-containing protein [Candidatus Thermoplasmatota archaeon]
MARALLLGLLVLAGSWAGCVGQDGEPLASAGEEEILEPTVEESVPLKPPVARMTIFDGKGVLAYQATFAATDDSSRRVFEPGEALSFLGGASAALEGGAKVETYQWDLGDGTVLTGPTVSHAYPPIPQAKIYAVRLTVTDTHGEKDSQTVLVGVYPSCGGNVTKAGTCLEEVQVVEDSGSLTAGTYGVTGGQLQGRDTRGVDYEDHLFTVVPEIDGKLVLPKHARIVVKGSEPLPGAALNVELLTSTGWRLTRTTGGGAEKELVFAHEDFVAADYTARVVFTGGAGGASGQAYSLSVEVVYLVTTREFERFQG